MFYTLYFTHKYVFDLLLLFLPFTGLSEKPFKQVHFFLTFPSSQLPKRIFRKIGIATLGSYIFFVNSISIIISLDYLFKWIRGWGGKGVRGCVGL